MFDTNYYKSRFVRTNNEGINALYEVFYSFPDGLEMFRHEMNNDEHEIYLVHKNNQILKDGERDTNLGDFLTEYGYTNGDFSNPFNRTKKILTEIKKINEQALNNPVKTKKK